VRNEEKTQLAAISNCFEEMPQRKVLEMDEKVSNK